MTTILVDLGNTALKWAVADDPEKPQTIVHQGSDALPERLQHEWLSLKPDHVVGCMVSSENLAFSLTKFFNRHRIGWEWLHSERRFEGSFTLVNRYENYQQLGSDRWYAAIGAASLFPGRAVLVVHMGTATTVDAVIPEGNKTSGVLRFMGGRIIPGPAMMYGSLINNTRCRPGGGGVRRDFPANTADAISTGILEAHLGVIDRAVKASAREGFDPLIVCAGGAAPLLAPYIVSDFPEVVVKHNLVLNGLASWSKKNRQPQWRCAD